MPNTPYERRRSEDVYRALETDVFPRLDKMDNKIETTEKAIHGLQMQGCVHRASDLQRTQAVEDGMTRIFERINDLGENLSSHQVAITEQVGEINTEMVRKVGGVRIWVLTSCVFVLLTALSFIAKDFIVRLFG